MDIVGVVDAKDRTKLFDMVVAKIGDHHDGKVVVDASRSRACCDVFGTPGREDRIRIARAHLLQYPAISEFSRNWN